MCHVSEKSTKKDLQVLQCVVNMYNNREVHPLAQKMQLVLLWCEGDNVFLRVSDINRESNTILTEIMNKNPSHFMCDKQSFFY